MTSPRRIALVTGASRGIGRSTALALAGDGFDVAFTARTVTEGEGSVPGRTTREAGVLHSVPGSLDSTTAAIQALGVRALPLRMDLADPAGPAAVADLLLEQWGAPTVLVNNAVHHVPHARFLELDLGDLRDSLESNLVRQVALVQALLPAMVAAGGGIVANMCSGSASIDPPGPPGEGGWGLAYAAAKAGFGRIAGAVNAEFRDQGIRAFNLEPGFVVTESGRARGGTDQIEARGFTGAPVEASGRVIAWLARSGHDDPEANALLGTVIDAPRLSARLP
ncbi:SDR family NAD(P)-dependent oxidoreductase [Nocardioides sp. Root140]|uniref:SDR family NAD(P)-dependent oxidoreductase n=1 Tax=Nocardioides sp. Root140 TaxID=1736460 RepID=UPI0006FD876D|nr:SDR family oxidoreductase [Nocardioides sp. Root140]KQY50938.1 oxidoreductase [Nocardioides sp. Root140]